MACAAVQLDAAMAAVGRRRSELRLRLAGAHPCGGRAMCCRRPMLASRQWQRRTAWRQQRRQKLWHGACCHFMAVGGSHV